MDTVIKMQVEKQKANGIFFEYSLYSERWIRPYESLWSIIQSIKHVNTISDKEICRMFGTTGNIQSHYEQPFIMYFKVHININKIMQLLHIPKSHFAPLNDISIRHSAKDIICSNVRYCPVCMKEYGYHSYYHQVLLIEQCPWHGCRLEETKLFYGLQNRNQYCYGLDQSELPSTVPLPCLRKTFSPQPVEILQNVSQIVLIKENSTEKLELYNIGNKDILPKIIFKHDESPLKRYMEILNGLEEGLNEKTPQLQRLFIKNINTPEYLNTEILYYYDIRYYTYCFLHQLIQKSKGDRSQDDILNEDIFRFYRKRAEEPLYAAMMFAVNIAATDNVFDALSRKFYLSPNSGSYRINILHTSWIRYEPYDSYYLQVSNRIKTDDRQLFYLCMSYEIIWRFLNHIWEQYLEMLNRNITYADMSKNLVYPSYMVVETAEEDWYIVEL